MDIFTSNIPVIFNNHTNMEDISCDNIDVSNVHIKGNLLVDGSFNIGDINYMNQVIISTQVDILNTGSSTALKVTQSGSGDNYDVALFNAGSQGDAFKIDSSGKSIFYKNVDINGEFKVSINNVEKIKVTNSTISVNSGITLNTPSTYGLGLVPIGGIIIWTNSTIPNGFYLCNGSNGTPNLTNRFIYTSTSAGASGGSFNITTNQIPSHTHPVIFNDTNATHNHNANLGLIDDKNFTGNQDQRPPGDSNNASSFRFYTNYTNHQHTHGYTLANAGGGNAYYQPHIVLAFIKRGF